MADMTHMSALELQYVQGQMQVCREEIAKLAMRLTEGAGFQERGARNLAALMACMGAAQILALSSPNKNLYAVFRMLAMGHATDSAVDAVMKKIEALGPEALDGPMGAG